LNLDLLVITTHRHRTLNRFKLIPSTWFILLHNTSTVSNQNRTSISLNPSIDEMTLLHKTELLTSEGQIGGS
jgi:hypothetical protein